MTKKLIIAVDLDGVCTNHAENINTQTINIIIDDETNPIVKENFLKNQELKYGVKEALNRFLEDGHHIRIMSNRRVKSTQNFNTVASTADWLAKNKIPYTDIVFLEDKTNIDADIYIDDDPETLKELYAVEKNAIIFDHPRNHHIDGYRAGNWLETVKYVNHFVSKN